MAKIPRVPKLNKSQLKVPKGYKAPKVEDLKSDMKRLGNEIAEEFLETIVHNIETNEYEFTLKKETIDRKGSDIPLIDKKQLLGAIYRKGTTVSVEDTPRTDSPLSNLELAMVHEYGTKDKHIPARPVWRNTYRDFKPTAEKRVIKFLDSKGEFKTNGLTTSREIFKKEQAVNMEKRTKPRK